MVDALIDAVRGLPPVVATAALATIPFTELRAAIPIGILVFEQPAAQAAFAAFVGNAAIATVLLVGLGPASALAQRWSFADRIMQRVFDHTRRRHGPRFERARDIALVGFVAVPLPGSGAWAGSLVAFLFGIPLRKALPLVTAGLIISATAVTLLVQSGLFIVGITRP